MSLHSLSDLDHEIEGGYAAKYVEGVIFVGLKNDKGETLMRLLNQLGHQPKKILFIDDKEKNLHSVAAACELPVITACLLISRARMCFHGGTNRLLFRRSSTLLSART